VLSFTEVIIRIRYGLDNVIYIICKPNLVNIFLTVTELQISFLCLAAAAVMDFERMAFSTSVEVNRLYRVTVM